MFCSHCGAKASGNFCSACGSKLNVEVQTLACLHGSWQAEAYTPTELIDAQIVWQEDVRYDWLLQVPEVRERIAVATAAARKRMTGEEFLELAEKALEPLLHGVPVSKVAVLVQPLYARLGIGTSKSRSETVPLRAGETIVAAVCSLAAAGMKIKHAQQAEDGCVLSAEIPSDWRSFAGELAVAVHAESDGTRVEALAKIGGQLYDWGKNQQALDGLFRDLRTARIAA